MSRGADLDAIAELIATNHTNVTKDKLLEWQTTWQHFCDEELGYQVRGHGLRGPNPILHVSPTGSGFAAVSSCTRQSGTRLQHGRLLGYIR